VQRQLAEYFAGERTSFDLPTIAAGDAFQRATSGKLTGYAGGLSRKAVPARSRRRARDSRAACAVLTGDLP